MGVCTCVCVWVCVHVRGGDWCVGGGGVRGVGSTIEEYHVLFLLHAEREREREWEGGGEGGCGWLVVAAAVGGSM